MVEQVLPTAVMSVRQVREAPSVAEIHGADVERQGERSVAGVNASIVWVLVTPGGATAIGPTVALLRRRTGAAEGRKERKTGHPGKNRRTLDPLQSAFLVGPDVADDQDGEENRHFPDAEPTHQAVPYGPRE